MQTSKSSKATREAKRIKPTINEMHRIRHNLWVLITQKSNELLHYGTEKDLCKFIRNF